MKTLNYSVLFVLVLVSFGFVSFGCGESDSPTAPSSVMQPAPQPQTLVSFTDPTDDIEWSDDAPSDGRSTDLIRMDLFDQNSEGWFRVTFTLAGSYDPAAHPAASLGLSLFPNLDTFYAFQISHGNSANPNPGGTWARLFDTAPPSQTYYDNEPQISDYIRSVPALSMATTLSFEIKPPPAAREIPLRVDGVFVVAHGTSRIRGTDWIDGNVVLPPAPR